MHLQHMQQRLSFSTLHTSSIISVQSCSHGSSSQTPTPPDATSARVSCSRSGSRQPPPPHCAAASGGRMPLEASTRDEAVWLEANALMHLRWTEANGATFGGAGGNQMDE
jgi:hypothetical protein